MFKMCCKMVPSALTVVFVVSRPSSWSRLDSAISVTWLWCRRSAARTRRSRSFWASTTGTAPAWGSCCRCGPGPRLNSTETGRACVLLYFCMPGCDFLIVQCLAILIIYRVKCNTVFILVYIRDSVDAIQCIYLFFSVGSVSVYI